MGHPYAILNARVCRIALALGLLAFLAVHPAFAGQAVSDPLQRVSITSSPNPVGSGARAAGMGNAFVAVADDATAASWNPAGLVQLLRPEVSAVGVYREHREWRDSNRHPEAATVDTWEDMELNFASAVYPFALGKRNVAVTVNYQQGYDFEREIRFRFAKSDRRGPEGPILEQSIRVEHDQEFVQTGRLGAAGLGFAIEPHTDLLIGANVNFWHQGLVGSNHWEHEEEVRTTGTISVTTAGGTTVREIEQTFFERQRREISRGVNGHAGVLWQFARGWTLGAVYKSPLRAHIRAETSGRSVSQTGSVSTWRRDEEEVLEFPWSAGLGLSYRWEDSLTLSLDVTRTAWDEFELTQSDGDVVSPFTGGSLDSSDVPAVYAVRAGVEYLLIRDTTLVVPFRAGVFYDPEPLPGGKRTAWGASVGSGFVFQRATIDWAYTFRRAEAVEVSGMDGVDSRENRHLFMLSAIWYF